MDAPILQPPPMIVRGLLTALGILFFLFGLFFLYFGIELVELGGSYYYLICSIPLIISGIALFKRRRLGAWLYLLTWLATIPWTIYEVQFNWWGWLPRLFGPTLLAVLIIILFPFIYKTKIINKEGQF